jgi:NADH:ubiquinone oxidoreductase subunit 6 (subunit J)
MTILVFLLGIAMVGVFATAFYQFDYKNDHEKGRFFVKIGSFLFILFVLAMIGSVLGIFIQGEAPGYKW